MTVNQYLALLGVLVLSIILAAGFKLAFSDIDMNSSSGSPKLNRDLPQASIVARRPRFAPLCSLLGWVCLLFGIAKSFDYIPSRSAYAFWLAMSFYLACFAFCYFDYKEFLRYKQGRSEADLRNGLTVLWHGLSILGLTIGCVPPMLILVGNGLARVFP